MSKLRGLTPTTRSLLVALMALAMVGTNSSAATAQSGPTVDVIVQELPGAGNAPEILVTSLGGKVAHQLPIISGFAASVPQTSVAALAAGAGVRHVSTDRTVNMKSDPSVDASAAVGDVEASVSVNDEGFEISTMGAEGETDAPPADPAQPASVYRSSINATKANSAGFTGKGVVVALIDTGVSNVPDLADRMVPVRAPAGNYKRCVDLSGDRSCEDTYGHGTFIAGLIAGTGASSNGLHKGVAPEAKILSIKIAGADGSAPVSKIMYAIQWVVQNKDAYGIDVLNLSLGTDSTNGYQHDPFNYAVEQAWMAGVSVVVSAGNLGPDARTIAKPADDPFVITVGATDDMGTRQLQDDQLPNYSSQGPTAADGLTKPDVSAPGSHLVSLRAPGSMVEKKFPGGVDETYRRGSGTSMSAGVVSGSIALLLQAKPAMTPDEVKFALMKSAKKVASNDANQVGAGSIDIGTAIFRTPQGKANQGVVPSDGTQPVSLSQGSVTPVVDGTNELVGDLTSSINGILAGNDPTDPSGGSWYGTSWYGGSWYGGSWYGGSWYGGSWYGGSWYGGSWYGQPNGGSWYGGSWYGGSWYGAWG